MSSTSPPPIPLTAARPPKNRFYRPLKSAGKPWWERLFSTKGFVTLVTVVGTGWFGTVITANVQNWSNEKDLVLSTYSENQSERLKTSQQAFELMGAYITGSSDLIRVGTDDWMRQLTNLRTAGQLDELVKSYNRADVDWRKKADILSFLLSYHFQGKTVGQQWNELRSAVESFNRCAVDYYIGRRRKPTPIPEDKDVCDDKYRSIEDKREPFIQVLDESRQDGWKRWGILKDESRQEPWWKLWGIFK